MTTLTQQQRAFFDTFGYLVFPGLLADRIEAISQAFEDNWVNAGRKHDNVNHSVLVQFMDRHPGLHTLLDTPPTHDILTGLLGEDFNYVGSDGNYFVTDSQWHSDTYGVPGGLRFLKMAFYLDPVTRTTGALRVIPGSHRLGEPFAEQLQREIRESGTLWGVQGAEVPAVALDSNPGDVVVFDHALKHAAFGGSNRRRMFTMNCCQRFPDEHISYLRQYIGNHAYYKVERLHHALLVETASPTRRVHLEQGRANDGHLAGLLERDNAQPAMMN
jgi:ectoine hydroxylase-related dioxygenase (phytanoyl-CoA dioxygenase family)